MDKNLTNIKLLICDVDGILTDGQLIKDTAGEESKSFNVLDGVGFVMLRLLNLGIKTAWITGRESATTESRAEELQIDDIYEEDLYPFMNTNSVFKGLEYGKKITDITPYGESYRKETGLFNLYQHLKAMQTHQSLQ